MNTRTHAWRKWDIIALVSMCCVIIGNLVLFVMAIFKGIPWYAVGGWLFLSGIIGCLGYAPVIFVPCELPPRTKVGASFTLAAIIIVSIFQATSLGCVIGVPAMLIGVCAAGS